MGPALAGYSSCWYLRIMLNPAAYIPALLHRYDCVVIPGLGGFVANYSPARLDKDKGVIYPPSKGIIFNKNLVRNDGLLVNEMAGSEQLGYEEALAGLEAFVQDARQTLMEGGRIELEGLGYLYFDAERNIQYLPYQTVNFLNDSYGLSPVMAVPMVKKVAEPVVLQPVITTAEEKKAAEPKKEPVTEPEKKEATIVAMKDAVVKVRNNRKRYYLAAAVLLPVLFYTYWLPFQTPMLTTGQFNWSYLNPFGTYPTQTYQERASVPQEEHHTAQMQPQETVLPEQTYEKPASETTYVTAPLMTEEKHFHIIAGCFVNYDNALTQISELKAAGSQAYLFGRAGGFYRVSLGSYASEREAIDELHAVRSAGQPNAWLLEE